MPQLPIGDIGPCEVTWDYGGATPVIITPHLGKVTVRMADAVTDVFIDGQGIAPIEAFFEGSTVELEVPMARSTLSQLANTIGYRDLGTLAGNVLTLHNVAGIEMMAHAKQIVIKPMLNVGGCSVAPNPDPHSWLLFYNCHPWRDFELGFDRSGQRVHMVKFKLFPNQDTGYEGDYFQEGVFNWIDDFSDAARHADWTDEPNNGSIVEAGDVLTLAVANGVDGNWWEANIRNAPFAKLSVPTSKLTVITKLNSYTVNDETNAGLMIGNTLTIPDNAGGYCYSLARMRDDGLGKNGLDAIDVGTVGAQYIAVTTLPIWLRMVISGSGVGQTISFDYSTNGSNWITLYIATGFTWSIIGLHAKNWGALNAISAPFEYFEYIEG